MSIGELVSEIPHDERVVSMIDHGGRILIATESKIYELYRFHEGTYQLRRLKFVVGDQAEVM